MRPTWIFFMVIKKPTETGTSIPSSSQTLFLRPLSEVDMNLAWCHWPCCSWFVFALIPWTLNNVFFSSTAWTCCKQYNIHNITVKKWCCADMSRRQTNSEVQKKTFFSVKVGVNIYFTCLAGENSSVYTSLQHLKQKQRVSCPEKWWQKGEETAFPLGTSWDQRHMSFKVSWLFGLRIWEIIVPSGGQEKMMQATSSLMILFINNFKLQGLYPTVLTVLSCCFKEWVTLTHWDSSPVHGRKGRIPCLSIFAEDGSNCTLHDKPPKISCWEVWALPKTEQRRCDSMTFGVKRPNFMGKPCC